jgi:hypothetical protein
MESKKLQQFNLPFLINQEEENKIHFNAVLNNPYLIEDEAFCFRLLPFSIGFEIECDYLSNYDKTIFQKIPNLIAFNTSEIEQSFRIPPGLKGMRCLSDICNALIATSSLNYGSGIHYHVDMTDWWELFDFEKTEKNFSKFIFKELDKWKYEIGTNSKEIKYDKKFTWLNFRSDFKTAEYRIGEMTFDYTTILIKMLHASYITDAIYQFNKSSIKKISVIDVSNYPTHETLNLDNIRNIINNRLC